MTPATKPPLTQRILNATRCEIPGCDCQADGIVVHARCHPGSPTWATYDPQTGTLAITCAECDKVVVVIAVAE